LIRNEQTNCSLWEFCHATVKSEAITCARSCQGGGQQRNNRVMWSSGIASACHQRRLDLRVVRSNPSRV
jgi:hypothetical protein